MRTVLFAAALLVAQVPVAHAIDASKSSATFSIQHIFVERVTGRVPVVEGQVELFAGSPVPTRVAATLDATKIATGEPDRDTALRGPEYFDTAKFPTWSFVSTKIVPNGTAAFEMDGTLTIHGVPQPEQLKVTVSGDAMHPVYHAVAHIDRTVFGMKGGRLDPVIGKTADVSLDITLR